MSQHSPLFPATTMPDREWWSALWPDPADTLKALGIQAGQRVVDLCCGDGFFTAPLSQLVGGGLYGVDLSEEMLAQARAAVAESHAPEVTFIAGDARDLQQMIPEPVDLLLIANTFHGVPDKPALCQGVYEVLKPGGHFIIVNWHRNPREETLVLGSPRGPKYVMRMTPQMVREVVELVGFELQEVIELPPYHYGAVFVRN
uniref:Putative Methyltransferase family protein n=1 Tax=Magnetococcus massalia (strain MO-1) TaxID=451514 RepID=A0A1S7LHQ4_MAGMO|nr:putative Methyltransferase family protein [Candidatus Magnetococcus massalia]